MNAIKTIGVRTIGAFEGKLWDFLQSKNYDSAAQLIVDYCTEPSEHGGGYSTALFNNQTLVEKILAAENDALNRALIFAMAHDMRRSSYDITPQPAAIVNVKAIILAAAKGPSVTAYANEGYDFSAQLSITTLALALSRNYRVESFLGDTVFMQQFGQTCRFTRCAEGIRDMIAEARRRAIQKQATPYHNDDQLCSVMQGIFLALKAATTNPAQQDPDGLVQKILEAAIDFPDPRLGAAILADPITATAINQSYLAPLTTALIVKTLKTIAPHHLPELHHGLSAAVSVGQWLKPDDQLGFLKDIRAGINNADVQCSLLNPTTLLGYDAATLIRFSASMVGDDTYLPCLNQIDSAFRNQDKILQLVALLKVAYSGPLTNNDFYNFHMFCEFVNSEAPLDHGNLDRKVIRRTLADINQCIVFKPPPQNDKLQRQAVKMAYELVRNNMTTKDLLGILRQNRQTATPSERSQMQHNFNRTKKLYRPLRQAVGLTGLPSRVAGEAFQAVLCIFFPNRVHQEERRKHFTNRPSLP